MKYEEVVTFVNCILSQYTMPLTIRQIYYRLVADYNYPNRRTAYNQLSKQLVKARKQGDVDEAKIEDRSRNFLGGDYGFNNSHEFLVNQIAYFLASPKRYSKRMWTKQPRFVMVWIEKDALSRIISKMAERYRVITAPSRGYASYTYIKRAIETFPIDKEIIVLHFADHDPSGLDMTRDLYERLNDYSGREIKVERVALSYEQVLQYNLAPNPTKSADPRAQTYISKFGNQCWELDAIEPNELQRLVEEAIVKHIDEDLWEETLEEEKEEREQLRRIFSEIKKKLNEIDST
ncbi:MAG: hypothetical protein DRO67_02760 [Candidatus Asgardarchaeum californiense]|nr:MAG: hypothetical protein DRO67_02760 [Candidatus Asgardarchaeum californiense]